MTIKSIYMSKGRQEGWQEGRQEGLQEGRQEGQYEEKYRVAGNMLRVGLPEVQILQCTGLSMDDLGNLKQKLSSMLLYD